MAVFNVLRLCNKFSAVNINTTAWDITKRGVSNKALLELLNVPEKPKRPKSSFVWFLMDFKSNPANKHIKGKELMSEASTSWRSLSSSEKQRYKDQYKKDLDKYKKELKAFEESLTPQQKAEMDEAVALHKTQKEQKIFKILKKKKMNELKKPKPPTSAFIKFCLSRKKNDDESFVEYTVRSAKEWSKLHPDKKNKYVNEYENEKNIYEKELLNWEEKMINEGHVDIVRTKTLKKKLKVLA